MKDGICKPKLIWAVWKWLNAYQQKHIDAIVEGPRNSRSPRRLSGCLHTGQGHPRPAPQTKTSPFNKDFEKTEKKRVVMIKILTSEDLRSSKHRRLLRLLNLSSELLASPACKAETWPKLLNKTLTRKQPLHNHTAGPILAFYIFLSFYALLTVSCANTSLAPLASPPGPAGKVAREFIFRKKQLKQWFNDQFFSIKVTIRM